MSREYELPLPNPDAPLVCTDDIGATIKAMPGFATEIMWVGKFYPKLCQGKRYAIQFHRKHEIQQQPALL